MSAVKYWGTGSRQLLAYGGLPADMLYEVSGFPAYVRFYNVSNFLFWKLGKNKLDQF